MPLESSAGPRPWNMNQCPASLESEVSNWRTGNVRAGWTTVAPAPNVGGAGSPSGNAGEVSVAFSIWLPSATTIQDSPESAGRTGSMVRGLPENPEAITLGAPKVSPPRSQVVPPPQNQVAWSGLGTLRRRTEWTTPPTGSSGFCPRRVVRSPPEWNRFESRETSCMVRSSRDLLS